MTEQLPLLFAAGSDTSAAAALSVAADTPRLREMVLFAVRATGDQGMTCDEAEMLLGMRHQTISARFTELRDGGWIRDSGQRRRTRSLRNAAVWVAT